LRHLHVLEVPESHAEWSALRDGTVLGGFRNGELRFLVFGPQCLEFVDFQVWDRHSLRAETE